jgi:dihydrolipoamide dehydrogenase
MGADDEFDIVVIGGGPGGYGVALYGAAAGLSVAIVERDKVGGTCLHRGCVPAKEFLETAAVQRTVSGAGEFGINVAGSTLEFSLSQDRKNGVVDKLFKGLAGLLKGRKVTTLSGTGTLKPGRQVEVVDGEDAGRIITGRNVVLAAGSVPRTLPGLEVDGSWVMTLRRVLGPEGDPRLGCRRRRWCHRV